MNITPFDIPYRLFTEFNDLKFIEKTHQYFLDKRQLTSVTTYIHKFQEPFNEKYWSLRKAEELGVSQADILKEWKAINLKSQVKGSVIHNYLEWLFNNKVFDYPKEMIIEKLGEDNIHDEFRKIQYQIDKFYKDTHGKLIPIKTEYVMYDEELGIAGMCDMLFWNVKYNYLQIYDWKTNKKLRFNNHFQQLKHPLNMDDCEMNIYSLQLNTYKYILQKKLGITLGPCYIVWFNEQNTNYQLIKTHDYLELIPKMVSFKEA